MIRRIDDSISKIEKVANKLNEDGKTRDSMLLVQAVQNLVRVRDRLGEWAKIELERDVEKTLKRTREILGEK